MELIVTRDPEEFAAVVDEFLAARVERNVLATVLAGARGPDAGLGRAPTTTTATRHPDAPLFIAGIDPAAEAVAAAALRTPPWPLLATGFDDPDDAAEVMRAWLNEDPDLGGISAEPSTARAIATAWEQLTGGTAELEFREAMHALTTVIDPPRPAEGRLRVATQEDRATLIEWERGFCLEAGLGSPGRAAEMVDRRLVAGRQYVWETGAEPTTTVAHNAEVAGTCRIGPVYTPPEQRNRGYASAAVAALSRKLLADGSSQCMLLTDLANPTANHIYAAVGYARFGDWEQYRFHRPD